MLHNSSNLSASSGTSTGPTPADLGIGGNKFPFYLEGQLETAMEIASELDDKRFVLLSARTGSGKSLIYSTLSKLTDSRTLVLVGTKGLQSQLLRDFADSGMRDIRGHGNYSCANETGDRFEPICSLPTDQCLYRADINEALQAPIVVSNYAYWMALAKYSSPDTLGKFDLLVLDEAHTAPAWLTNACSIVMYKGEINNLLGIDLPTSLTDVKIWCAWAEEAHKLARIKYAEVRRMPASGRRTLLLQHIAAIGKDLSILAGVIESGIEWVGQEEGEGRGVKTKNKGARFTPIWPQAYAEQYLYRGIDKIVLCSATLSKGIRKYLDIGNSNSSYISVDSSFDPKRCPFIFVDKHPRIRVDRRMSDRSKEILIDRIDSVIGDRLDRKGIIHTRSYDRAKEVVGMSKYSAYMMMHGSYDARQVIERFKRADAPCILVSPSVEEGFDFVGDECRWQVIIKVPFLDSRDPVTKARSKRDKGYSNYITSQAIVQMVGRGMRSEQDYCETIIFDSHWTWFQRVGDWPEWFRRTFRSVKQIPKRLEVEEIAA